jgi:hypothetical protein
MMIQSGIRMMLHPGWIDNTRAGLGTLEWMQTAAVIAAVVIATGMVGRWLKRGPAVACQPHSELIKEN